MNSQTPTKKDIEAVDRYLKRRDDKADPIVTNALISMFQQDLPAFDAFYIERRLRELIEDTLNKMDFKSDKLTAVIKEILPDLLTQMKIKISAPLEFKKKKDLTTIRDARCEPIVHELAKAILSPELLFTDDEFMEIDIRNRNQRMFTEIIMTYVAAVTDGLLFALQESLKRGTKALWDGKDKEQVTLKQIDEVLKKYNSSLQPQKNVRK